MDEWYPERLRQKFLSGLDAFEAHAVDSTGSSFVDLDTERQRALLADAELGDEALADDEANPSEDPGGDPYDAADSTSVSNETVHRSPLADDLKTKVSREIDEAARRVAARRPDGGPIIRADVDHEGDLTGDPSFFGMLKELTLVGYYTSEVGATEELQFVQVPGRWEPCVSVEDVGRTWAA